MVDAFEDFDEDLLLAVLVEHDRAAIRALEHAAGAIDRERGVERHVAVAVGSRAPSMPVDDGDWNAGRRPP